MTRKIGILFLIIMIASVATNFRLTRAEEIPEEGEIIVNKEGYKLVEVLSIPWGDGEDEISILEEGYRWGPQYFIVDNESNIYIDDPGKRRAIKYTTEGEFIYLKDMKYIVGVFDNGNIFGRGGLVYNSEGKLIDKIRVPLTSSGFTKMIQHGTNIYITTGSAKYNTLVISNERDEGGYKIAKYKEKPKGRFSEQHNGYPSKFFDVDYEIEKTPKGINVVHLSKAGEKTKEMEVIWEEELSKYQIEEPEIIGEDNQGNIYCILGLQIPSHYYPKKGFIAIQKYNKKGEILLTLRMFSDWSGVGLSPYDTVSVDHKGNIYQLYVQEKGIKVIKWER